MNCPSSAALPRAENASEWADAGHDEHAELASEMLTGDLPPWIARVIPSNARPEVALAYDVANRTGRIIGENIGRAYGSAGPFEICGSADAVGTDGDSVVVVDFKTGFMDVEPAATNAQLAFYALAACRALGKSEAIVRIIYTKSNRVDEATLDTFDLSAFASRLEELHRRTASLRDAYKRGEVLETREGSWCKHCASKPYCPSKTALIRQMSGLQVVGDAVTKETVSKAYEQVVRIEMLVREARKRLEVYVDENGPIDLGNGRMFGRYVRQGNERLSGNVTVQAIAEVVGESANEFASVAIERSTSKAAIERAAKSLGCPKGTAGKVIKRVRELGGATRGGDSMPLGEYVRGADEPAERPVLDVAAVNAALESA